MQWRRYAQRQRQLDAGGIVQRVLRMRTLTDAEVAAYRAPFPRPIIRLARWLSSFGADPT